MSGTILVVDDDRDLAETLCDVLTLRGWTATPVFDGESAVERIREAPPDVVLMDIRMPGINGVDAFEEMRRIHSAIRVILMTAYSSLDLIEQAKKEGVVDVLEKPVSPRLILDRVAEVIEQSKPVLVVDDNPEYLETLAEMVKDWGYEVLRAGTLAEALRLLEGKTPSVVVLDMRLDSIDPADCVFAIKAASPQVIFVLYSGHPELIAETRVRVPDEWVDACLHKPFPPESLLEILDARSRPA